MSAPAASSSAPAVDQSSANADYMARSRRFPVLAPLVGGALKGNYALGTTLNFIFGPVNNGWLDMIELDISINVTMATATAAANAGAPWNLVTVTVNLDGQISYVEPYFACYLLPKLKGRLRAGIDTVLAGISNANEQSIVYTFPTTWAVGANAIRVRMAFPLNALHPLDGSGLLPTQGVQDPVQINVMCPSTLIGNDPWLYPAASATGVGTITGTSTVTCYGWVRDGRTLWAPSEELPFYPNGLPQVSYDREPDVVNLVAGSIVRGMLTKVLKVYYAVAVLIDGNSSALFATNTNVSSFDLSADSSGNFELLQFGLNNVPVDLLFEDIRARFGQDMPQGVIPFVYAPHANIPNPDAATSTAILNMTAGGWTSLYMGVNFITQGGVTNAQPRIHICILGTNDSPYIG